MNTLEKLFTAVRTATSPRMKRFATSELIKQLPDFSDHVFFILQNVYEFICSENGANRECAEQLIEAMDFFDYGINFSGAEDQNFRASGFVYLQTQDTIQDVPTIPKEKQQRLIRKKLKLDHADDRFISALGTEEQVPTTIFRTAEAIKKGVENVYDFFSVLNLLLLSPEWYKRHGAFLAYRAILAKHARDIRERDSARPGRVFIEINPNIYMRIFEILHNDKFNDFQEDRTSAPVREAATKLLRQLYPYLSNYPVIEQLISCLRSTDWQVQFSGLLGLLELRECFIQTEHNRLSDKQVIELVELLCTLFECTDEDVKYLSAELLSCIVSHIELPGNIIKKLAERAWSQIEAEVDIAHSKASMIALLQQLYYRYRSLLPDPESFEIFCPCFTSSTSIIRESVLSLCRLFFCEEMIYMLAESILLSMDDAYIASACSVLMLINGNGIQQNNSYDLLTMASHFLKIISTSLHRPYDSNDFACYEETFFTKDGILSIGSERVLANRVALFSVIRGVPGLKGVDKTMLGCTLSSLLSHRYSDNRSVTLNILCSELCEGVFKRFSSLRRMPVQEFKRAFDDYSYSSPFALCDQYILDYTRIILSENVSIVSDLTFYLARETCTPMLRLLVQHVVDGPRVVECTRAAYFSVIDSKNTVILMNNLVIFFEVLGMRLLKSEEMSGVLDEILKSEDKLYFFRATVHIYAQDGPTELLDRIFHEAMEEKDSIVLKGLIGNMRYNEEYVRTLLREFDAELFAELLEYSDPSFNVLFAREILRDLSGARGLLNRIVSSLYFTANPAISADLRKQIEEERKELAVLVNPSGIPEYEIRCECCCELRDYQRAGIRWMAFLNKFHLNGILADDMGLGKTVQMLTYLISEISRNKTEVSDRAGSISAVKPKLKTLRSLIVCPSSLITHWQDEAKRFYNYESAIVTSKTSMPSSDLVIASYDTLRRDSGTISSTDWFTVVFDEGHILRNRHTVLYQKASSLKSDRMFILTGTPVHNSVDDLFSLFNLILPNYLGTDSEFASLYSCKVTDKNVDLMEGRLSQLQKKTLPFILRRLKTDVLKDLPPKIIKDVLLEMNPAHCEVYTGVSTSAPGTKPCTTQADEPAIELNYSNIKSYGLEKTRWLLKAVSHPRFLGSKAEASKLTALKDIFAMCEGHKILIFFQLQKTIDFVLEDLKLPEYMRLDSSVPVAKRGEIAKKFNNGACPYLFLTTSVGGLGLNLTSANTVVFYEHDWNPFNDLQAMDRAHRLGQKQVVNVFRLISRGTIEEKVMSYQKFKMFVANSLVTQQNADIERMETKDLLEKLQ